MLGKGEHRGSLSKRAAIGGGRRREGQTAGGPAPGLRFGSLSCGSDRGPSGREEETKMRRGAGGGGGFVGTGRR